MIDRKIHNENARLLAKSYTASAGTERRLASHALTSRDRKRHQAKARRWERLAREALATQVAED